METKQKQVEQGIMNITWGNVDVGQARSKPHTWEQRNDLF